MPSQQPPSARAAVQAIAADPPALSALPFATWLDCAQASLRMQAGAWRLTCAQADAALRCTHQILVGLGWPDPLTDRSLWWAAGHFADTLEPFPQKV